MLLCKKVYAKLNLRVIRYTSESSTMYGFGKMNLGIIRYASKSSRPSYSWCESLTQSSPSQGGHSCCDFMEVLGRLRGIARFFNNQGSQTMFGSLQWQVWHLSCIQRCPSRAHGMSYSRRVRPHKEGTHVKRSAGPHPSRKGIRVAAELVPPRGGHPGATTTQSSLQQGGCPRQLARVPVRHRSFFHPGGTNVVDYFCH